MNQRPHPSQSNADAPGDACVEQESAREIDALAALVSDSLDAPDVPASLGRRLDDEIGRRWGQSPKFMSRGRLSLEQTSFRRTLDWGSRKLKSWRAVATTAALILVAVLVVNGSGNRAWAAVRTAMAQHGVLEIRSEESVRWLDLSQRVAGRQTDEGAELLDLRRRLLLCRSASEPGTTQKQLPVGLNPSDDAMIFAFLTNRALSIETFEQMGDVDVVVDQSIEEQQTVLPLRFRMAANSDVMVQLALDGETNLPLSITRQSSHDVNAGLVSITTSSQSIAALASAAFPAASVAVVEREVPAIENNEHSVGEPTAPATQSQVAQVPGTAVPVVDAVIASLPVGAAKQWGQVAVVSRADDEVLDQVNQTLANLWDQRDIVPVERASNLHLLRRAYLDLAGRTPTVAEAREFLREESADRYERLVDQLIGSPDHASQLAAVWRSFLIPEGVNLDAFGGLAPFEEWLAKRFSSGVPYDQIVRELLLAEGRLAQSGPLLFYSALKLDADQLAARTSRAFLGMRLECAQCHDHPFEPWTQDDFWSYAAFFAQISRPKAELENASTVMQVRDVSRGEVMIPYTDDVAKPRLLGRANAVEASLTDDEPAARRQVLSAWLTSRENPYFARATVNRLWAYFFGRGIVDPVDDFGVSNEPVSPALLDTLASQLIENEFDLSRSIRTIVLSDAYKLESAAISDSNANQLESEAEARLDVFAQMNVKTLTAEQLYDCIAVATMLDDSGNAGQYAVNRFGNSQRDAFLQTFAAPASSRSDYLAGIPQALTLMNGSLINNATGDSSSGVVRSLQAPFFTDRQRVDVLFLGTLSRPANPDEQQLLADLIPEGADWQQRSAALSDILWALLNSSEFALNH